MTVPPFITAAYVSGILRMAVFASPISASETRPTADVANVAKSWRARRRIASGTETFAYIPVATAWTMREKSTCG